MFHGGFLLVDLATLLVIAAAVHPRRTSGPILGCAAAAVDRPALLQPLPLALPDLLRDPARPRRARSTAGRCSRCASCCRSARPISRTATSRRRSAAARSAATSSGMRVEHGAQRARLLRGAIVGVSAILIVVVGLGASLAAKPGQIEKIPGAGADAAAADKGDRANAQTLRQIKNARNTTTTHRTADDEAAGHRPRRDHDAAGQDRHHHADDETEHAPPADPRDRRLRDARRRAVTGAGHPRDLRRREGEPAVLGRDPRVAGVQERRAPAGHDRRAHGHERRVQRRAVRRRSCKSSGTARSSS